jgi:hypothetical protein
VIEAAPNQLGPMGQRLILGPFRFVNHDCKPNAQVSFLLHSSIFDTFWVFFLTSPIQIFPIPDTYACVMATIQPIAANEEITIKYQQSGYYGQHCLCSSCTGKDTSNLSILKPNYNIQEQLSASDSFPNVEQ